MLTWSLAWMLLPLLTPHTSTVVLLALQLPTCWPLLTSVTDVNPIVPVAEAGNVIVIALRPAPDIPPPVAEVVKVIRYSVRPPAAVEGEVLSTVRLLTDDASATPAKAAIVRRVPITTRATRGRRSRRRRGARPFSPTRASTIAASP